MTMRSRLAEALHSLKLGRPLRALQSAWGPSTLTVINYHRVNVPGAARELDEGTLDATPAGFDAQVAFLKREFDLLTPQRLREHLHGRPWPRRAALITFDDGYLDNAEQALPILQRHGATALFFIATSYVDQQRVFWWDRISYIVKHARRPQLELTYPAPQVVEVRHDPAAAQRTLHALVKRTPGLDLERFLSHLAEAADVAWTDALDRELASRVVMTWEHVRELHRAGMGIGSHTRSHRVLGTVPHAELDDELAGSRRDLAAQLHDEVWAIAYPVGYRIVDDDQIVASLEHAGYEAGFSYGSGVQRLDAYHRYDLSRLGVEHDWPLSEFALELLLEGSPRVRRRLVSLAQSLPGRRPGGSRHGTRRPHERR